VYVVVIAPKERNAAPLQQGLKTALEAVGKDKLFKVQPTTPLTRESGPDMFNVFDRIHRSIKARALDGFPTNDLVLVYFQGAETIRGDEHYLWTARTAGERDLEEEAVNLRQLARVFDDFLGAQVVLMDTVLPPKGKLPPSEKVAKSLALLPNYGLGVLHHRWVGGAGSSEALLLREAEQELPRASGFGNLAARLAKRFPSQDYVSHMAHLEMAFAPHVATRE
jgi:hypothetical protein